RARWSTECFRIQYRFLDLRRKTLQDTLLLRHRLCKTIRDNLDAQGFVEVETPLLGKSTPEGARDYLVPSRLSHGEWRARRLPGPGVAFPRGVVRPAAEPAALQAAPHGVRVRQVLSDCSVSARRG